MKPTFSPLLRPAAAVVLTAAATLPAVSSPDAPAPTPALVPVEGQPLAAQVRRLGEALTVLGRPLPGELSGALATASRNRDAAALQTLLDPHVLLVVHINPELRVKLTRGPAPARLQQGGFTPVLVKVLNEGTSTRALQIGSPQAGPVYAGSSVPILERQAQTALAENENLSGDPDRFLEVEVFRSPPLTPRLSGLQVEYLVALLYSSETGLREATLTADLGQGTQDLGFRSETPVLFEVAPALPVRLEILEQDGTPSTARLTVRDALGHVYPPQAKRVEPDFFFQPQIYRRHGEILPLPPGAYSVQTSRGPEYHVREMPFVADPERENVLTVRLERWVDPSRHGFYCGDHHIHGAGCSHYTSPSEGVSPDTMFRQVQGEGLHVGCVLTWGPCFDYQRQFFSDRAHALSEPFTVLKYDLEISGFGSAAMGHVCLLNLTDQTYPGSDGSKERGWPSWTVPVLRWCKEQGGYTGYPHSAMSVQPAAEAQRLLAADTDGDAALSAAEASGLLLPDSFAAIDTDASATLTGQELQAAAGRVAGDLPHYAVPAMDGAGAMEVFVSAPAGVCDFLSAMDTARVAEWNAWDHKAPFATASFSTLSD